MNSVSRSTKARRNFALLAAAAAFAGIPYLATHQSRAEAPRSSVASRVVNVLEAGAAGDGKTLDTRVVQSAIDRIAAQGGGVIVFPPGTYLLGTVHLRDHITLDVNAGATILGAPALQEYPEIDAPRSTPPVDFEYPHHALISGYGVEDVAIVGQGTLDGQGGCAAFNEWRKYKGKEKAEGLKHRPYLLAFSQCKHVRVQGVTLHNSAYWVEDYLGCDNVLVSGITVESHDNGNNDGIDIDASRNVRVSDSTFDTGDDALCLKASYRDCEDVAVSNCVVKSGCNGIKFGTASGAGFKNISISNCVVRDTQLSGVALEIVDGGTLDGVVVHGVSMSNVGTPIFLKLGERGARYFKTPSTAPAPIGQFRNVDISDIVATTRLPDERHEFHLTPLASSITGLPGHPLENISVSNLRVTFRSGCPKDKLVDVANVPENEKGYPEMGQFGALPAYGLFCRHVAGLTLRNIDVTYEQPDARPALACDDVQRLSVDGLKAQSEGESPVIVLNSVDRAAITNSASPDNAKVFIAVQGTSKRVNVFDNDLRTASVAQTGAATASGEIVKQNNRSE